MNKTTLALATGTLDWLRLISIVCCVLGILVAGYMAWAEVTGNETMCADTGSIDCQAVQQSAYAETFGIPVAILGLLGYVAMLGVLILEDQVGLFAHYGRTLVAGMSLFGFMFQSYLTYVEADVLGKWCQWCVASYVLITLIFGIAVYRIISFLKPLRR
ncbi:MAG: vitamin K epoxide reductase family protein [Chloroflexi bacterium]|nr:vitamin K epoxide reductase family protein [Chloroflexota bacterium]